MKNYCLSQDRIPLLTSWTHNYNRWVNFDGI